MLLLRAVLDFVLVVDTSFQLPHVNFQQLVLVLWQLILILISYDPDCPLFEELRKGTGLRVLSIQNASSY